MAADRSLARHVDLMSLQLFVSVVVFRYFMLLEQRPQLEPRDH